MAAGQEPFTGASGSEYRLAPDVRIRWGKDSEGNDVGDITFDVTKFVEVNGEVLSSQREGRLRFTLQELFDRELSVYELDPVTLQPTGAMKSMIGAEVMQYFKGLFEVLYAESTAPQEVEE